MRRALGRVAGQLLDDLEGVGRGRREWTVEQFVHPAVVAPRADVSRPEALHVVGGESRPGRGRLAPSRRRVYAPRFAAQHEGGCSSEHDDHEPDPRELRVDRRRDLPAEGAAFHELLVPGVLDAVDDAVGDASPIQAIVTLPVRPGRSRGRDSSSALSATSVPSIPWWWPRCTAAIGDPSESGATRRMMKMPSGRKKSKTTSRGARGDDVLLNDRDHCGNDRYHIRRRGAHHDGFRRGTVEEVLHNFWRYFVLLIAGPSLLLVAWYLHAQGIGVWRDATGAVAALLICGSFFIGSKPPPDDEDIEVALDRVFEADVRRHLTRRLAEIRGGDGACRIRPER